MAKSISTVAVTDTFQVWLEKTNELVGLINSDVVTASAGAGDTTVGNVKLTGNFTANNYTANTQNGLFTGFGLRTSSIAQQTGNTTPIAVTTAIGVDADQVGVRINHTGGGRARFSNTNRNWDIGHGGSAANSSLAFIWNDILVGALTTAGGLELLGGVSANANSSFGSGGIQVGAGTVALPSIAFSAESNTGIYRPAANTIGFAVAGAQKLAISNTAISANIPVLTANGAAVTPAYAFSAAPNTGMFYDAGALKLSVNGSVNFETDWAGNIALYGTGTSIALRTLSGSSLDLDANSSTGIRVGRNSAYSKLSFLKPNTTTMYVEIGADDTPSGNSGFVRAWQGPGLANTPAFGFVGDPTTGLARLASNTLSLVSGAVGQMNITANGIVVRAGAGIKFNNYVAAGGQGDPSGHIDLYGNSYGFGITDGTLNVITPASGVVAFTSNTNVQAAVIYINNGNGVLRMDGSSSAAVPAISFIDDPDTGIWRSNTNSIGFTGAGVNRAVINSAGLTLQNDGRFIASNRQDVANPDFCFSGAGNYGMFYQSSYLRFAAAGSQIVAASSSLFIHYTEVHAPKYLCTSNPSNGLTSTAAYPYMLLEDTYTHRFDLNAAADTSVITRSLGDARYQRTSSRRFKENIVKISSDIEKKLLDAFDKFDFKTWVWGGEIGEQDERRGTVGIGLIAEELETYIPEAVRYQWTDGPTIENEKKKPTKKQANALDDSPIIAAIVLKIRQLEARLEAVGG